MPRSSVSGTIQNMIYLIFSRMLPVALSVYGVNITVIYISANETCLAVYKESSSANF